MNNKISKYKIKKNLKYNIKVIALNKTNSTNDDLKKLAQKGILKTTLLCADTQKSGRGRQGNSFFSPKGGIYLSILFTPNLLPEQNLFITTMAALSTQKAIEKVTKIKTKIKWVNDLYIESGKVSGILTESKFDFENKKILYTVLGIGVNLFPPKNGFPDEIRDKATSLFVEKSKFYDIKNILIAEITNEFFNLLNNFEIKKHIEEYKANSFIIGKDIEFQRNNEIFEGNVLDIDDNLNLVVNVDDSAVKLSSGEIVIKNWN